MGCDSSMAMAELALASLAACWAGELVPITCGTVLGTGRHEELLKGQHNLETLLLCDTPWWFQTQDLPPAVDRLSQHTASFPLLEERLPHHRHRAPVLQNDESKDSTQQIPGVTLTSHRQQISTAVSSPAQLLSFSSESFEDSFGFHILLITVILHVQVHLPTPCQPAQLCRDFPAKRVASGSCLRKQARKLQRKSANHRPLELQESQQALS